ncbi:MAG TPA: gliding motility-associated C-terminal domain-containing protein [Candidatus Latescibacteria bacterium]|jgi:hypothetical protein|nr:hypothetical protein [Gemmatimonadaceae bacterium]MDP6015729.1 gliding motility-associated C-terminal domain-containing protein [Candidatus Latescibacterota bacterium]HJP29712.1 gliding motility-associated C-terminal domain-containing protein [Candidatus Latescibacterota bacterium]
MSRVAFTAAVLLVVARPAETLDTLRVGGGSGQTSDWRELAASSQFVAVTEDSIWTWTAARNTNLVRGIPSRGGFIGAKISVSSIFGVVDIIRERPGLSNWIDGDAATAWGPDEDDEVGRNGSVFIDLGATFRVNRLRFFPRLDTEHRQLSLGRFEVGTATEQGLPPLYAAYRSVPGLSFNTFSPNLEPVVEVTFERRDVRFIRLQSHEREPWELAEFEVFTDGSVPAGEFVSVPLFVRGGFPVWGRVSFDGGDLAQLPVALQTRTGPDDEPLHFFLQRGDELEQVTERQYLDFVPLDFAGAASVELGPIRANPEWSPWQAVADGQVVSPSPQRYLQFRVLMREAGTRIGSLFFEYVQRPLADRLVAEVSPLRVDVGEETRFTLSMEVHIDSERGDTGFRYVQVLTPATIGRVLRVLVDDEEAVFTPTYDDDGFTVDIWERIVQSGTFLQIEFTATVLGDGAAFEVRARDLRPQDGAIEPVYQTARPGDVDPLSVGGELVVRLTEQDAGLVAGVLAAGAFTPNGDGINDVFEVSYDLLKLTRPAPVFFEILDLAGGRVLRGVSEAGHGRFVRVWTGRDEQGRMAPPGLYIYRVRVEADAGVASRSGIVGLVR